MAPSEVSPAAWLERARADVRVAELALGDAALPPWPAGFHLQQAAEKAFKAVLVAHGRVPPRTHDLALLADAVEALEPRLAGFGDRLLALNEFGVAQRYPGVPDPQFDVRGHLADVRSLVDAVTLAVAAG